jgi:Uncharacterized protein conserved in bacteria (DUF2330)
MRRHIGLGAVLVLAIAADGLAFERAAWACGGCFVPPPPPTEPPDTVDSAITGERMIFSISKDQTTLYDEITFSGSPSSFAWVLPIRGTVTVGLSADTLFATLDSLTATVVNAPPLDCPPAPVCASYSGGGSGCSPGCAGSASVSIGSAFTFPASDDLPSSCTGDVYWPLATGCGTCPGPSFAVCDGTTFADCVCSIPSGYTLSGAGTGEGGDAGNPVTVGPYEVVQLHSKDGSALNTWLDSHGYKIAAADAPVVAHYVAEGMDFLAMKLVPGEGVSAMQPVRVTTQGAFPTLPLRMVSVGTGATTGITIWVVADGRWEPQNFPFFTIGNADLVWDWNTNSSNYEALRQSKEKALHGAGWLIESSLELNQNTIASTFAQALANEGPDGGGYLSSSSDGGVIGDGGTEGGEAKDGGTADAGSTDADAAEASQPDDAGDASSPEDAGDGSSFEPAIEDATEDASEDATEDAESSSEEKDLAVLFAGIAGPNVRITRIRGDIAHSALSSDLVLQASSDQSELSNILATTSQVGQPLCPSYDQYCNLIGEVPRDQAEAAQAGGGGCRTTTARPDDRASLALGAVSVVAALAMARKRGRRRR